MVAIIRTEWSGTSGGPGLSQMVLSESYPDAWSQVATDSAVAAVRTFWDGLRTWLPNELSLTVSPVVDMYNLVNGQLVDSFTAGTAPLPVAGAAVGAYAGGAGFKVTWNTGQIKNGRRVRGSTYVVPAASTAFDPFGNVGTPVQTAVNDAASGMLATLSASDISMLVWSRPRDLPTPRVGTAALVMGGRASNKSAILRGRRD